MILDYLVLVIWAFIMPVNIIRLLGHLFIRFFRRFGIFSFLLYIVLWVSCAILIFLNGNLFLQSRIFKPNIAVSAIGIIIFCFGMLLQILGFKTLGIKAVFGISEILPKKQKGTLIVKGPFLLVRHPLYLGQLLLLIGALLLTFELSLFVLLAVVTVLVWPITTLEERELIDRFGEEYINYQKRVPRILPRIKGCNKLKDKKQE